MPSRLLPSVIALMLAAPLTVHAAESISLVASTSAPAVQGTFTITVQLNGSDPYSVLGHCLQYDKTKIRLDSQTTGTLSGLVADSRSVTDINLSGEVRTGNVFEAAGPSYPDSPSRTGSIAIFTFTRIASGTTQVTSPVRSTTDPFGWVLMRANAAERIPTAPAVVVLTDPAPGNAAPVVTAGADQAITLPASATLNGTITDDGLPTPAAVSAAWAKVSGPGTVTFGAATAEDTTATFSGPGTYVLQLSANDGARTTIDTIQVTVTAGNAAPTVSINAPTRVFTGQDFTVTATTSDDGLPSAAPLALTWTTQGARAQWAGNTGTLMYATAGSYVVRVTVSDGAASTTQEAQIIASDAEQTSANSTDDDDEKCGLGGLALIGLLGFLMHFRRNTW